MYFLWFSSYLMVATYAASCGSSSVPYSLEVLSGGSTVIGCARPNCFGWNPFTGFPMSNDAWFLEENGHPDGFLREGPVRIQPFDINSPRSYQQQAAVCNTMLTSDCAPNQWVAGISSARNNNTITAIQCCTFGPLWQATDRGVASLSIGQIVIGGEVMEDGVQTFFDYIRSVRKVRRPDGSLGFDVGVGRFNCHNPSFLPAPITPNQAAVAPPPAQFLPPPPLPAPQSGGFFSFTPQVFTPLSQNYYCFSGDTEVRLADGSNISLSRLKKGDWVETMIEDGTTFMPVSFWLHRDPKQSAEFLRFTLSDGSWLKMTAKHYIYETTCVEDGAKVNFSNVSRKAVFADRVQVGNCLYCVPTMGEPIVRRVIAIEVVKEVGIYAPMVSSGKIVVNGYHASCHSVVDSQVLTNLFFSNVKKLINTYHSWMGSTSDMHELPYGVELVMSLTDLVLPTNLASY